MLEELGVNFFDRPVNLSLSFDDVIVELFPFVVQHLHPEGLLLPHLVEQQVMQAEVVQVDVEGAGVVDEGSPFLQNEGVKVFPPHPLVKLTLTIGASNTLRHSERVNWL